MYPLIIALVTVGLVATGCGDNAEPREPAPKAPAVVTTPTRTPAPEAPGATLPDVTTPDPGASTATADNAALQAQVEAEEAKVQAMAAELAQLKALQEQAKKKVDAAKPTEPPTDPVVEEPKRDYPPVITATTVTAILAGAQVNPTLLEALKKSQEEKAAAEKKKQQMELLQKEFEALQAMKEQQATQQPQGGALVSSATEQAIPYFGHPDGEQTLQSFGCPTDYVARGLRFRAGLEIDGINQPWCAKLTNTAAYDNQSYEFGNLQYIGGSGGETITADCGVGGVVVGWRLRKQLVASDVCNDTGADIQCGYTGLSYVEVFCRAIQPLAYGLGSGTWTVQPTHTDKSWNVTTAKVAFENKNNKGNFEDSSELKCPGDQVVVGIAPAVKNAGQPSGRLIGLAGHCASLKTDAFTKPTFSVNEAVFFGTNGIGVPSVNGGATSEATYNNQSFITDASDGYLFNLGADWILSDVATTMVLCPHQSVLVKGTNQTWTCRTWNPSGASGVEKPAELWVAGKLVDEIAYGETFPKLAKSQTSETESVACPDGQYATGIKLATPAAGYCAFAAWGGCGSSQPNAVRHIDKLTCNADAAPAATDALTCGAGEHLVGLIRFADHLDAQGKHVNNGGSISTNYFALCSEHTVK
ncbi:MAG: hypothetical protein HY696_02250 [Deltaproteobacteria bacterium]|nr:hypothetical protein [Deltaproteobacteria bacterium]